MSISTYGDYVDRRQGWHTAQISKASVTAVTARCNSGWTCGGFPAAGAAPTTAVVPTNATTGALKDLTSAGTERLLRAILGWSQTGGMVTFIDRLSHQGGLSGVTTGAQTTNLPTAALTRRTSGVGVMLGLEIYTQIGATTTSVSASYTNQAGTTGRTTPLAVWGNTGFREAIRMVLLPLKADDTGVRAVASVTNTATTGTAGNFGVTLFYPHVSLPIAGGICDAEALLGFGHWFPLIDPNACMSYLVHPTGTTTGSLGGELIFGED